MERMTAALAVLLLALGAAAQDDNPFKGKTKVVKGPEGRVTMTVPLHWREQQIAGNIVLRVSAPHGGGHDVIITREAGQSDIDKQRDRYIAYDSGKYAGAEVKKYNSPFFGFRLNAPGKNVVLFRSFITDGDDGLVVASTSRLKMFDEVYSRQILAVIKSVSVSGGGAARPDQEGGERRVYDKAAIVSLVAPAAWKSVTPEESENEVLVMALKGSRAGPTMRMLDMGSPTNANLVLSNIGREWKQSYGSVKFKKFRGKPPRMMCNNRKAGWIDYIIAFEASGHGYAFHASMREGAFEKYRSLADTIAKTVVFTDGAYTAPKNVPGDVTEPYKKSFVLHAKIEQISGIKQVTKVLGKFQKYWGRIGIGKAKKPPPIHIAVVGDDVFDDVSHGFGEAPASYDRSTCTVVVTPRPADKKLQGMWGGRLYAALAEAVLHRDMAGRLPPWLKTGLIVCMESAGRSGEGPDRPHATYVDTLDNSAATDQLASFAALQQRTNADYLMAQTATNHAMAWGYTHLILFGNSRLTGIYRKWKKAVEKSKRGTPKFDLGKYKNEKADFKKHIEKVLKKP